MAYSLLVASCFLFCASAIQEVHIHRKVSQFRNINGIAGRARGAVDRVVDSTNDAMDRVVDPASDAVDRVVDSKTPASGGLNNVLGSLDGLMRGLDATVLNATTLFHGAGLVDHNFVADVAMNVLTQGNPAAKAVADMVNNAMTNPDPVAHGVADVVKNVMTNGDTGFMLLNAGLQAAELLVNDTAQTFEGDVRSLDTLVAGALNAFSAAGLDTAQTALTEKDAALEPLHQIERALNVTKKALAVAADPALNAGSVQGPLGLAVAAATQTLTDLSQENSTGPWISNVFDAVLGDASRNATMSPDRLAELGKTALKAAADSTKLVKDMEALVNTSLKELMPAMQQTKDVAWNLSHPAASGELNNVLGALDGLMTGLDATVLNDTTLFHGAGSVDRSFVADVVKNDMTNGDPVAHMVKDVMTSGDPTGFMLLNAGLQAAELLVNDTAQTFEGDVRSLDTLVTGALTAFNAAGLDTAQTALTEKEAALEPLHQIERALNVTKKALAVAADPALNAENVQDPLQEAVAAATQTLTDLSQENSTGPWISNVFDAVLGDASRNATMSPDRLEELSKTTHKAAADSTKLVKDMEALVNTSLKEVTPAMQQTKDVTWKLSHPGQTLFPSAAGGSRFFSAAVGGVVLMALTAATA